MYISVVIIIRLLFLLNGALFSFIAFINDGKLTDKSCASVLKSTSFPSECRADVLNNTDTRGCRRSAAFFTAVAQNTSKSGVKVLPWTTVCLLYYKQSDSCCSWPIDRKHARQDWRRCSSSRWAALYFATITQARNYRQCLDGGGGGGASQRVPWNGWTFSAWSSSSWSWWTCRQRASVFCQSALTSQQRCRKDKYQQWNERSDGRTTNDGKLSVWLRQLGASRSAAAAAAAVVLINNFV